MLDLTLCSAVSDLSLCCLPRPHIWDAGHKWVINLIFFRSQFESEAGGFASSGSHSVSM